VVPVLERVVLLKNVLLAMARLSFILQQRRLLMKKWKTEFSSISKGEAMNGAP
jgi:hypothetical protein